MENSNLQNHLRGVVKESLDSINNAVHDPIQRESILDSSFESALVGIRKGVMTYENDALMPLLRQEMDERIERFQGLSEEDEGKLLSLSKQ